MNSETLYQNWFVTMNYLVVPVIAALVVPSSEPYVAVAIKHPPLVEESNRFLILLCINYR